MDSILEMYLYETDVLLEQLDSLALAAERATQFSQADVDEIFRIMHTIKGSSAMMEFTPLMTVAHRIEDMFFIIRENGMDDLSEEQRSGLFDLVFQATDYFRGEVEKLKNQETLSQNIDSFVEKINTFIVKIQDSFQGKPAEDAQTATGHLQPGDLFAKYPQFPHGILVFFDEDSGMESLRAFLLVTAIRDICAEEDMLFFPDDVENNTDSTDTIIDQGFLLLFRNGIDCETALQIVSESPSVQTYEHLSQPPIEEEVIPLSGAVAPAQETVTAPPVAAREEACAPKVEAPAPTTSPKSEKEASVAAANAAVGLSTNGAKETLISVSLSKLDQLMAVVGEIVITESMVTASPDLHGLSLDNFTKSARQLRKLTDELQDVSMSLRMVPVSGTFQKMNRIVRDMGKKLNKAVKLTIIGEDTEIDKSIVDGISDSIMHIVRNSMDHGIEANADDRLRKGKSATGNITLAARHTGSEVMIDIIDDGQGVNYDKVLQKAIDQGLASPDVEYTNREITNFLIMPGFSTKAVVTEFSGRGVGMDVVKQSVDAVGGNLSISSEPDVGMTTTLKIPLTMAIMDGMKVSVGSSIFTIPIHNIRQSFKVTAGEVILDSANNEIIKCMDSFYPIIRAKNLYSLEEGKDDIEEGILIWVESGEISYCLFVDELIGEQQVVVKPLPIYVNSFHIKDYGISGCTILGDGNISIILDIANIYSANQ